MKKPNGSQFALARCARTEEKMKKFIVSIVIVAGHVLANSASAQWATVVEDGSYYTPSSSSLTKSEAQADKLLLREANSCIGQLIVNCGNGPSDRCRKAYGPCGDVYEKAKSRPGVGAAWVMRQIALALKNLASKEDLEALRDEIFLKLGELEKRIAELEKRMDAVEADVATLKERADTGDRKDAVHDARLNDHEERLVILERRVDEHDLLIARMGQKVRFDMGVGLVLSSDIYGVAGVAGLNFAITDVVRAKVHIGLGVSFDAEAVLAGQAGPEFVFGEKKNLAIGIAGLFLKEGFNDAGDAFIGGGPEFSFYFGGEGHGFVSILGAVGTSTTMVDAPMPGYLDRREREWALGWAVVLSVGGTF